MENNIESFEMPKEEIYAFWNYSRILDTIPDEAFEKDIQAKKMLECYHYLEAKYYEYMRIVNSKKEKENEE